LDSFWIIGGGKFGLSAARTLSKKHPLADLIIVEKEKAVCRQLNHQGFDAVCRDGIQYLERNLASVPYPDWIIPAIPLHTAFEWIKAKLSKTHNLQKITVPKNLITQLPNPIHAETGQIYVSIADFRCPANCPEPDEICTHTGKRRLMVLHDFLRSIQLPGVQNVAIQSHQLAPGAGGYRPAELFAALNQVRTSENIILLSTACSCHGVMNAFRLSVRSS
jgi:hypothetical protein